MPVRTKALVVRQFWDPTVTDVLYECPAGETAIVKEIVLHNRSGAPRDVGVAVRRAGVYGQVLWVPQQPNESIHVDRGRFTVLAAGDQLTLYLSGVTASVQFRVHVSGTELEGVAD